MENKILIEQKINQDLQNDLKKKIEYNNIKEEAIKQIDTTIKIVRIIKDPNFSSENNISNNLIPKNEESDEEDLKFDEIMNKIKKDDYMILINDDNERKVEKKYCTFNFW